MTPQRLSISYSIEWQGFWHVGSGFGTSATDRLVQRLGGRHGQPFVPGSQIKGVLRHTCERLARALTFDFVDPHATSGDQHQRLVRHFRPLLESPLIIDRLFGTRFQGDCLFVDNATPPARDDNMQEPSGPSSTVRARTAMDRVTGTAKERHLFTTELSGPCQVLSGDIRARHPAGVLTQENNGFPYEYSLLVAGLLSIESLGGDKSTGLGQCRIRVDTIAWNSQPQTVEDCLATFAEEDWKVLLEMVRENQQP